MTHPIKSPFINTASLLITLTAIGCGSGVDAGGNAQPEEQPGEVTVAVTNTPVANTCLVLTFAGATSATTYTLFATAGTSTASVAVKLAVGTITVTPLAYVTATCSSSGVSSLTPAWYGPSVTLNVLPGTPTQIPVTLHPYNVSASVDFSQGVKQIALGDMNGYALLTDGTMRAWGHGSSGELGNGTTAASNPTPVVVNSIGSAATALATGMGGWHMCALNSATTGNNAYCWGYNYDGGLGNGTTNMSSVPVAVSGSNNYALISVAGANTWATVRPNGTLWSWGANESGQLGTGSTAANSLVPVNTYSFAWDEISSGPQHFEGRSGSTVWSAGANNTGGLGTGDTTPARYLTETFFATGLWPVSVSGGDLFTCAAVSPNGAVQCAGYNGFGQLGDGTTTNRAYPVTVPGLTGVTAVSAGADHTCALKNDGTIWCWGANYSAQLGDGTTTERHVPTQVRDITDARTVVAGRAFTCALRSDATAWCWGTNGFGQLGDGTTIDRAVPTKVLIQ